MGRAKQLLTSGFSKNTKDRIKSARIRRRTGRSGDAVLDEESDRMTTYIKSAYLENIFDYKTAREAFVSLTKDNKKGIRGNEDFRNLLRNIRESSKERYINYLFERFGRDKYEELLKSRITLKSGKMRTGYKTDENTYLIYVTINKKNYIQARDYKTGRIKKFRNNYFK